jgi:N-acetylglucosaminyldiphosphoundecaprenol N-acetyl-beta-D-mannosaminyltransferase
VTALRVDNILGVNIAVTNMESTIHELAEKRNEWKGQYICVSNVHTTVMAHENPEYMKIQNEAVMALPDGSPLSSYSRENGKTTARRVTGPDLMRELLTRSGEYGFTHFFYGSTQDTLDKLRAKIEERYPDAKIVGMISPPFRDLTPEEDEAYVKQINEAAPDFVWVGLGAPKQEIWMAAHKGRVNALMIGVRAAFAFESGKVKRAPKWVQNMKLEWFYRMMQDPKRLFKRYFVTNIKYLWLTRK